MFRKCNIITLQLARRLRAAGVFSYGLGRVGGFTSGVSLGNAAHEPETEHPAGRRYRELEKIGTRLGQVARWHFMWREPCFQDGVEGWPTQFRSLAGDENTVMAGVLH